MVRVAEVCGVVRKCAGWCDEKTWDERTRSGEDTMWSTKSEVDVTRETACTHVWVDVFSG